MEHKIKCLKDIDANKTCFFSGHRKIPSDIINVIELQLNDIICTKYKEGIRNFISGGALGFDTIAAEYVIKLKKTYHDINLIMFLPSRDYTAKWRQEDITVLNKIIKKSDFIYYTSEKYSKNCMKVRNTALVKYSSCGIAYLSHQRSGTSQTVSIAEKNGKPIENIHELNKSFK